MYTLGVLFFVLVCILMVIVILLQSSKGGGLSSSFGGMGGTGGVLGARGAVSFLQKLTVGLAIIYALLCIGINKLTEPELGERKSVTQEKLNEQQQALPSPVPGEVLPPPVEEDEPSGERQSTDQPEN